MIGYVAIAELHEQIDLRAVRARGATMATNIISVQNIEKAHLTFVKKEPRDLFYRAATELVRLAMDKKTSLSVPEALAVLLQTWNSAYYRYHRSDMTKHFKKIDFLYEKDTRVLRSYRRRTIENFVDGEEPKVRRLFAEFEGVLGPVGAAKALHLLAPSFFPLWDRAIAQHYKTALGKKGTNGERYCRFMKIVRAQQLVLKGRCSHILKRIDEYNYCKFTRHWL